MPVILEIGAETEILIALLAADAGDLNQVGKHALLQ
jgi:hypothetical protein